MTKESTPESWSSVFKDLVELIEHAPPPPRREAGEWTREDQAGAHAVAVAWGWLTRIRRTCEAVFLLEKSHFTAESRPLIRSVIEHTIWLVWAASLERHRFVEALLRNKQWSLGRTLEAAEKGWPLPPELQQAIRESQAEASDEFKELDIYRHLAKVVETNIKVLGGPYQYWLLETLYSHPTLHSANDYFAPNKAGLGWSLYDDPEPSESRMDIVLPSFLIMAIAAFGSVAGLSGYFDGPLTEIEKKMVALRANPA